MALGTPSESGVQGLVRPESTDNSSASIPDMMIVVCDGDSNDRDAGMFDDYAVF